MVSMVAIVAVPGVGLGFRISFRSGLSFPLSINSVSIRTVAIVAMSIAIMPQSMAIIAVPGVSFGFRFSFRSGLSFPLSIDSVSIRTVAIVAMSIAIMPQPMAIITVPGVSFSFSCWLRFRNSCGQGKESSNQESKLHVEL